jgi:carbon storage regulator CsrA
MLVLTRKAEQKIRIGRNISITILKVQGDQVSIGIDAPKELQIVREELLSGGHLPHPLSGNKKRSEMNTNKTNLICEDEKLIC